MLSVTMGIKLSLLQFTFYGSVYILQVCERHCGTFEVVACFGHLGHPHPSLRAPTSCTVRLQTAGGRIVAVHDVLEVAEVAEEFLPYEECINYEFADDKDEALDGLTAK
ncbi:hypothetical protein Y032_0001g471 [Ancylostoma ceylanicum]|uniref:Uncharacterized protein n=1 Tax=Ancylostoma ceylanicum TaxID=53326 RepID=A0A016W426_9BILA|nr:hypothetical protein Y032_0001g471 [Ancylostoma ceylanicum]